MATENKNVKIAREVIQSLPQSLSQHLDFHKWGYVSVIRLKKGTYNDFFEQARNSYQTTDDAVVLLRVIAMIAEKVTGRARWSFSPRHNGYKGVFVFVGTDNVDQYEQQLDEYHNGQNQ